jgi:TraM recognition site of TraD and TraG
MIAALISYLKLLNRVLLKYRLFVSIGISIGTGTVLISLVPTPIENPILIYLLLNRPDIYHVVVFSYKLFLFTTPYLMLSMLFSLAYIHFYAEEIERVSGVLPPYPEPEQRKDLFLIVGELHERLEPSPSATPEWLTIPEKGLYTGIASFGSIGSGKTSGLIIPAMHQLFGYRATDPKRKLSGIVLEVKGDLCSHLTGILKEHGRERDYMEVSLTSEIRYNPLNNEIDPYAQAFTIASIITSIWGKGKEPFWQQSYTDLVRYVIVLFRLCNGYLTLVDVFRTVISSGKLEELLAATGVRVTPTAHMAIPTEDYSRWETVLIPFAFKLDASSQQYIAGYSTELEEFLIRWTSVKATVFEHTAIAPSKSQQFDSVNFWYWEHWKFFRHEVKTSIIQGIAVFLSLFETDPDVRRVFCPPKELYDAGHSETDPNGRVLPPFAELIEDGKIIGLNFPVALNPALAKTIGTMMKIDYQRAVQLRIPRMQSEPERYFRPTVFICDEYQEFATVGGDNPVGDERFFALSRQPKCIPIVATQSVSSLKEALPNEGFKTLAQTFRTKIFLTTSDPDTARFASELCGKADKTKISYSLSESSNNANVGWLSGRTSSNKGSVSASKHYQKSKEPLFEKRAFFELKNAQAIVIAFDGIHPLPATYCYLKPDFLPIQMSWFEQESMNFDSRSNSKEF